LPQPRDYWATCVARGITLHHGYIATRNIAPGSTIIVLVAEVQGPTEALRELFFPQDMFLDGLDQNLRQLRWQMPLPQFTYWLRQLHRVADFYSTGIWIPE
jgi:hypothetical protein